VVLFNSTVVTDAIRALIAVPYPHENVPAFLPTPAVFQCANMQSAHMSALMLRHGTGGLAGPVVPPGQDSANWQILRIQSDTLSYY
jgi:hypothetical protein